MNELSIFKNMDKDEIRMCLNSLKARRLTFQKDHIILSHLADDDLIGIMLNGTANIIKYDYLGNRNIIDNLEYDSIFGKPFSYLDNDVIVTATSNCEILFLDYGSLIKNYQMYYKINNNLLNILAKDIYKLYERLEILSKKTIREKLLCYFNLIAKKRQKNTFSLSITYLELADYLSVDRSAMMREIKNLKNDGIIISDGKRITLKTKKESRN